MGPGLAALDWRPGPGLAFPCCGGACASRCNDEPAVSAASEGWAAVAPAKRGQATESGLDSPLSQRARRDVSLARRIQAPWTGDVTTMRRRTAKLGRRRRPLSKCFSAPDYPTGHITNHHPHAAHTSPHPLGLDSSPHCGEAPAVCYQ